MKNDYGNTFKQIKDQIDGNFEKIEETINHTQTYLTQKQFINENNQENGRAIRATPVFTVLNLITITALEEMPWKVIKRPLLIY